MTEWNGGVDYWSGVLDWITGVPRPQNYSISYTVPRTPRDYRPPKAGCVHFVMLLTVPPAPSVEGDGPTIGPPGPFVLE